MYISTDDPISFLFMTDIPLYVCTTSLSIHLLDGRLGCFHADVDNGMWMWGGGEGEDGMNWESSTAIDTLPRVK